jgi:hypothetical protein
MRGVLVLVVLVAVVVDVLPVADVAEEQMAEEHQMKILM